MFYFHFQRFDLSLFFVCKYYIYMWDFKLGLVMGEFKQA
jgi:hypothetical protein